MYREEVWHRIKNQRPEKPPDADIKNDPMIPEKPPDADITNDPMTFIQIWPPFWIFSN